MDQRQELRASLHNLCSKNNLNLEHTCTVTVVLECGRSGQLTVPINPEAEKVLL